MKKLSTEELRLCSIQANIFARSRELVLCSSPIFIRRFMNSNVAIRFDNRTYMGESDSLISLYGEIDEQYGESRYGKIKYDIDMLYWIGYTYRYWSCAANMPSNAIYKIASSGEMSRHYLPLHTMSSEKAVMEIMDMHGLSESRDEHLLNIMRRVMQLK